METQTSLNSELGGSQNYGKNPRRKWIMIGVAVIVVLGAGIAVAERPTASAAAIPPSDLYQVHSLASAKTIATEGTVQSTSQINLSFQGQAGGRVTAVKVGVGDYVKAGQVIATLDDSATKNALQQAESALAQAEAGVAQAQGNVAQAQGGVAQSQAGLVKATEGPTTATVQVANSNVQKAQAALTAAEQQYKDQQAAYNDRSVAYQQLVAAQNAAQEAKTALDTAQADQQTQVDAAQQALTAAQNNLQTAQTNLASAQQKDGDITEQQVQTAYQNYQTALSRFDGYQSEFGDANNPYASQMQNYEEVYQGLDQGYTELQSDQTAYNSAVATVAQAQSQLTAAQNGLSSAQSQYDAAEKALQTAQATYNDRTAAKQALDSAQSQVQQAKAALTNAQAAYNQTVQPSDKGTLDAAQASIQTSQAGVKTADAGVQAADAQVKSAEAAVSNAELNESYMTLKAPVSGVITAKNIQPGDTVSGGQTAFVMDVQQLQVALPISESQMPYVHQGQKVSLSVPEIPGKTFTATIFEIDPTPIQGNGTSYQALATLDNPPQALKSGMTGPVTIDVSGDEETMVVPSIALHTVNGQQGVYVYDPAAAKTKAAESEAATLGLPQNVMFQPVTVSGQNAYQDEVTAGLKDGDKIVLGEGAFLVGDNGTEDQS
ncbi:efflux RND transporter periplasmic adaptor subunit [Alicyclobacillus fastidiosus]|uniref:Efflux RND transporter periplasmic adaptor subunit n=1 Tax=Alicyclobacillus fastidiosus TaxID=392011 RepID=A0ABY6ZFV8_9BACL|nr:efflux RND transporter periplasmic adaptor subunit [Alicyclobacillus fastidiosus]WAH41794.1 efflux RND transporter periplasmic adaptor subunit [Alicyclobacillus fastidiosus]GMA63489.1 hypothetical protein GCM10025859_39290 [Alicyclobacillus fastidiosus]